MVHYQFEEYTIRKMANYLDSEIKYLEARGKKVWGQIRGLCTI